ncbi:glycosyltransferase family 4 protein [Flavobacterium sp.]|jgi:glycosyltransferase involved in cell wall biosynthesis|uniref:glycosyltransferase family 4 protein n=1 Tax=Flavobacterium sp. TaxID=239 RepID=UPI002A8346BB|nr:glycosyltransferase family 4 protein [Flavobacterium sp.]
MSKRILYIGNQLSKHGFNKTTIETLGSSFENEGYVVSYSSSKKNQIVRLFDMIFTTFWNAKKVDFILIDTYSTSSFWYAFFCSQIARVFKTKYIPILHGGDLPKRLDANSKLSRMLFNNAFKNVAPSSYLLSEFANKGYQNVVYIPNTIEIKNYAFKRRNVFEPKLLWVRAFATIYNPKMAVAVLNKLQAHYPNATLTMVGPDKDGSMEVTKQYAKELGIEVCFTNRLSKEEWINLSQECDFFINTTHFDNTPISVMEAMALGLPVVSTNVGGIPFLLTHDENAVLVNDNDSEAMTNAIVDLIKNEKKTVLMSENARAFVEQMDWDNIKKKWRVLLS